MSVNTSGGPLPEVRHAALNREASTSRADTANPRLRASVDAASAEDDLPGNAQRTRSTTLASSNKERKLKWYQYLGRGMYVDVKSRLPYYVSDWTDAWNYRVVPATLVSNRFWIMECMTDSSLGTGHLLCERKEHGQAAVERNLTAGPIGSSRTGVLARSYCE